MCFNGVKVSTMKRFLVYDTKLKIYSIKNRRTDFRSKKFVCVALLNSFNDWTSFCQIINLNLPRVQLTKLDSAFKNKKNTSINFQGLNINPDILHVNSELNETEDFLSPINELDKKCLVPCKVNLTRIATRPTKVPDLQIEDSNNTQVSLVDDNNENFKSKASLEMLSPKVDVGHLERNILAKNITEDASDSLTYQSSNAIEESSTISPYKDVKINQISSAQTSTFESTLVSPMNTIVMTNDTKGFCNDHTYFKQMMNTCVDEIEGSSWIKINKECSIEPRGCAEQISIEVEEQIALIPTISNEIVEVVNDHSNSEEDMTNFKNLDEFSKVQSFNCLSPTEENTRIVELSVVKELLRDSSFNNISDREIDFKEKTSILLEESNGNKNCQEFLDSTINKHHHLDKVYSVPNSPVQLSTNAPQEIGNFTQISEIVNDESLIADLVNQNSNEPEPTFNNDSSNNNFDTVFDAECLVMQADDLSPQFNLTQEDKLIELANLDFDYGVAGELNHSDDDLLSYEAGYEISDQLENILSYQLEGQLIDVVRDDSDDVDNYNLSSFIQPTSITLQTSSVTSLSLVSKEPQADKNTTVLSSSSKSFVHHNYDVNDPDFNPNEVQYSSTVLEDYTSKTDYETTNSLVPDLSSSENRTEELSEFENQEAENQDKDKNLHEASSSSEEQPLSYIHLESKLRKIPFARVGSIDNNELKVQTNSTVPRWKKKYHCMICHKQVVKLPRHLETVHKTYEDVKILKATKSGTKERKKVISIFRNNGNHMYNTIANYNKENYLFVPRRPKNNKSATDYTTCPNCLLTVTKSNSRKHIAKCFQESNIIKGTRTYKVLGTMVEGRLHATACDKLRLVIFPVLREDHIVRLIRYDWLIILWGNKLCVKHGPHFQHNHIRAKLRLLGRFLAAAKHVNNTITDLSSIFTPKYIDTMIEAIDIVARIDRLNNTCEAPANALNLVTYLKQIGVILEAEYVKKEDEGKQKQVQNFLKVFLTETPDAVNKIGMESQAQIKRQKVVVLPLTEDIQRMIRYLKSERAKCFVILQKHFNFGAWLQGLKLVAVYLLVFNRRRVGDIQNILVSDLSKLEKIDQIQDKEEFNTLDDAGKKIADNFYRFQIRGKVNRTVAVIANSDLIEELKILINYRSQANIPAHNNFLFGLPNPITDRIRVLNLCKEMRVISEECGAKEPQLLRGTGLRKHVATKCVELDLKASALGDVIGHLGHSEQIHKNIYQQKLKSKTIVQVTKVLEAAQGYLEDLEEEAEENDDRSDFIEVPSNESIISSTSSCNQSTLFEPKPSTSADVKHYFSQPRENPHTSANTSTEISDNFARNRAWSEKEKKIIMTEFKSYFDEKKLPSLMLIDKLKSRYPCLNNRRRDVIKTWISNQFKHQSKAASTPKNPKLKITKPSIRKCEKINFNFKKIKCTDSDSENESFSVGS